MFAEIKASLEDLYREDQRPWLAGFSGGIEFLSTEEVWADRNLSPEPIAPVGTRHGVSLRQRLERRVPNLNLTRSH